MYSVVLFFSVPLESAGMDSSSSFLSTKNKTSWQNHKKEKYKSKRKQVAKKEGYHFTWKVEDFYIFVSFSGTCL